MQTSTNYLAKTGVITFFIVGIYVAFYFVLMTRKYPAADRYGFQKFDSACIFSQYDSGLQGKSYRVSAFNYIFYPIDCVVHRLTVWCH